MELTPQAVNAYEQILSNPSEHGFDFKPIKECFELSDIVTAKHILYEQYFDLIKKPIPKVIFYILMDKMYANTIGKDQNGYLGYGLKLVEP